MNANQRTESNEQTLWTLHDQVGMTYDVFDEEIRRLLLEDFDYFVSRILTYSPLIDVIERRQGIRLEERFANTRRNIEVLPLIVEGVLETTLEERTHIMIDNFFYIHLESLFRPIEIGHMHPINRRAMIWLYLKPGDIFGSSRFQEQSVRIFYNLDDEQLMEEELLFLQTGLMDNVLTKVVVENEVAYIRIGNFAYYHEDNLLYDMHLLNLFFEKIEDYDHLIIDLRENRGGFDLFSRMIVAPLIAEPIEYRFHKFLSSNFYDKEAVYEAVNVGLEVVGISPQAVEIFESSEFITNRQMSNINYSDANQLGYAAEIFFEILPSLESREFKGEIWVLVDEWTGSAAEIAVIISQSSGFATVVGTNTAGVMPSASEIIILPNTGINVRFDFGYFTDDLGNSWEEFGIAPDYINRPGLNAFETVLELIYEKKLLRD